MACEGVTLTATWSSPNCSDPCVETVCEDDYTSLEAAMAALQAKVEARQEDECPPPD